MQSRNHININDQSGFTIVELVITIVLTSIVVSFMAMFIAGPVRAYTDQSRRAELTDITENAMRRIARDVRRALPNSVRVTGGGTTIALEMLSTVDGARYRDRPPPGDPDKRLRFTGADNAFNVVGGFTGLSLPFVSTSHFLSIYNVGVPGANAYELSNVITPAGTQIRINSDAAPGEDNVQVSPAFHFAYASPGQRVFLVDGAVTYLCDISSQTLVRYAGYDFTSSQASRDSAAELIAAGAAVTIVADHVSSCAIQYSAGTAQRAGLVTIDMAVSQAGETVSLLHQVHVDNVP